MSNEDKTILIVDDQKIVLDVTKKLLERSGYKVMATDDVIEAINIYESNHSGINAVLLNMMMPAMKGTELYKRMRIINCNVNAIIMSGYCEESLDYILGLGVKAFVVKPFKIENLVSTIENITQN